MGFPIKKRINSSPVLGSSSQERHSLHAAVASQSSPSSGLDLLPSVIESAAAGSTFLPSSPRHHSSSSSGTVVSASSTAASSEDGVDGLSDAEASDAKPHRPSSASSSSANGKMRSKTFPEVLMDILSHPDHTDIVGWLPHGRSFAIHDPAKFSSVILPKYFRKVIFRSFIRKLNRWGFRSVKRSVSRFESTFEHGSFQKDDPGMSARMFCKSNPASRASAASAPANKKGKATNATKRASTELIHSGKVTKQVAASDQGASQHGITPSTSAASSIAVVHQPQQPYPAQETLRQLPLSYEHSYGHPHHGHRASLDSLDNHARYLGNEEYQVRQLSNELLLRELRQRRQGALLSLVHGHHQEQHRTTSPSLPGGMSESDLVGRYVAEKWQRMLVAREMTQQSRGAMHELAAAEEYHRRVSGL